MNARLVAIGCALAASLAAASDETAELARISRERAEVEATYRQAEAACRDRFAVTACVDAARAERREKLQRLKAHEQVIDEQQRRRRAAQREETVRAKLAAQQERDRAAASAPARAASASALPRGNGLAPRARVSPPPADRSAGEARKRAEYEARQREAREHRDEVARRDAERAAKGRVPAAPLPVPGASKP